MDTRFIKIGGRYISIAHIIEITNDKYTIDIITAQMTPESVGADGWTTTNTVISYKVGTPEATALMEWADRQSEALA